MADTQVRYCFPNKVHGACGSTLIANFYYYASRSRIPLTLFQLDQIEEASNGSDLPEIFTPEEVRYLSAHLYGIICFLARLLCNSGLRLNEVFTSV